MKIKKRNFKCSVDNKDIIQITYSEDRNEKRMNFYISGGSSSVNLEEKELKMLYDTIGAVLRK